MVIDFHTHIFPDKIAQKTIDYLSLKGGIPPFTNGSAAGLLAEMEQSGVDIAVTLPVVTNPAQFDSINRFAAEINKTYATAPRRLISFAGIHPKNEDLEGKMKAIAAAGFLGVKIHPDYQETDITDEGYLRILAAARELDLIVVTHAGVDGGFRGCPVRCSPELARQVIDKVPHSKFVLAHCGGNEQYDEVLEQLCGCDVYFDTAYVLREIGRDCFTKILQKHDAGRILFASDSPWSSECGDLALLHDYVQNSADEEKILCRNAKKLLRL